jgi:hypothetical protein
LHETQIGDLKNIKHHTIIITSNDKPKLEGLRKRIISLYTEKMEAKKGAQLVSPLVDSLINNFSTFFIAPDGSKEGYDASDDGDRIRKMVIELIEDEIEDDDSNEIRYLEVFYGDDNKEADIINHN